MRPALALLLALASSSPLPASAEDTDGDVPPASGEEPSTQERQEEPDEQSAWTYNASFVIGGGWLHQTETGGVFSIGFRPEVFLPRTKSLPGLGLYAEVGSTGGLYYGTGLSLTIPLGGTLAVAPSVGVAGWNYDDDTQVSGVAGIFIGHRQLNYITAFDGSLGLRVDTRYGFDDEMWSVTILFQMDVTIIAAILAFA